MRALSRHKFREHKIVRRSFTERTQAATAKGEITWSPESHILGNLCMLGEKSKNGRTYTREARQDAVKLYENMPCYQDHPNDPEAQRSTRERIGTWHNIREDGDKVRGDLHFDPNHPYAKSLVWAAQECPEHCGVSHNVEAEGWDNEDGHFVVTRLVEARSADIVDSPATNRSLLESTRNHRRKRRQTREGAMDPELDREDGMDLGGESPEHHLGAFISAVCDDPNMDKAAKRKKIMKALDLYDEPDGAEMDMEEEEDEEVDTKDPEDTRGTPAA